MTKNKATIMGESDETLDEFAELKRLRKNKK